MFKRKSIRFATKLFAIALFAIGAIQIIPLSASKGQSLSGCTNSDSFEGTMFAVTMRNTLLNFNPGAPGVINSARFITGLAFGENVVGIDFRPADGRLYALSSASRLYVLNPATGVASPVGAAPLGLSGQSFGVDFNPVPDRLRVVSDGDQNLRINPNNGAVAGVDTALTYAAGDANAGANPNVVGAAYTNNFAGATSTTLYAIDATLDTLVRQGSVGGAPVSPNTGQLFTVGRLNVDTSDLVGFDIAPATNAAFASLTPAGAGATTLYTINLATGAATAVGAIGGNQLIRDIAFAVRAENVFAVTASNTLLRFNPGLPGQVIAARPISGMGAGETVVGMDFRPATGQLVALSSASRVYTINPANGVAMRVGGAPFAPALNGQSFGVDFNPVPDRIRVVSDAGQNLRLNPNTGGIAGTDGALAYAAGDANAGQAPNIVAAAYTNNFAGATATTLYVIDSNRNTLATQGSPGGAPVSPNTGQLFTVGSLGVDPTNIAGFDISSETGAAFAAFNAPGLPAQLLAVNLTSGAATAIGAIASIGGGSEPIVDIAIEVRVPTMFAVTAGHTLVSFNAGAPGTILSARPISGLPPGESILGIDFRPATGQLYALSSASRLYLLDPINAALAPFPVAAGPLNGADFGVDFNPLPDRVRVVSNAGQNLRLNPITGGLAGADTALAYAAGDANAGAAPNLVAAAYTNSFLGATTTTLYALDAARGALVTQGSPGGAPVSPNTGQLFTVGSLGQPTTGRAGFDLAPGSNAAFASLTAPGAAQSQLFAINLTTGAATLVGAIGVTEPVRGIAIGSRQGATRFDICLQDDRSGDTLWFNSCTGDYQFTRCGTGGFTAIGRGDVDRIGNSLILRDSRVFATLNARRSGPRQGGFAVYRPNSFVRPFAINDSGTADNTCNCR
jgi:trimeric autotransporter adhesin